MALSGRFISSTALAAVMSLMTATHSQAALVFSESTRGDGKTVVQFTSGSGSWTLPWGVTNFEVLVVGGGGGSGGTPAGGGGGFYENLNYTASGTALNVMVGIGGALNTDGGNSILDSFIAFGGKAGGGGNGGSSGGNNQVGSVGYTVFSGGAGSGSGAGAGQAGVDNWFAGGNGGNGLTSAVITGSATYYGGGGGATYMGGTYPSGGLGGGGTGGYSLEGGKPASSGVNGFGGGGGADRYPQFSGSGGSGIVAVAYAVPEPSTIALACCGAAFGAVAIRRRRKASR